ncbi:signal peptidase I [Candidatus Enterococcus mansonii]|uniref:Signal peptidase I n=1 Tax=Candidatus Enterococcus mansonii TaxID=1834181 RepID=A0A242CF43_9ENTE|nr:signal peptidase I [Enterococcus sp. 4G2_DIV0659]OTO08738.1 signal peptidase I [Enterococcus sp. 4G2_DIV0659]
MNKQQGKRKNRTPKKNRKKAALKANKKSISKKSTILYEIGLTLLIFLFLSVLINLYIFQLITFNGYSMVPTLNDQDRLFVYKLAKIKRFDLVYIKDANNEVSTRRVVGLPNEEVVYREDKLYIDNELKAERFLTKKVRTESEEPITENFNLYDLLKTDVVPPNKYFVLGDNREYSKDSRTYGFIDEKDIIGVVKARIFPFHAMKQF